MHVGLHDVFLVQSGASVLNVCLCLGFRSRFGRIRRAQNVVAHGLSAKSPCSCGRGNPWYCETRYR